MQLIDQFTKGQVSLDMQRAIKFVVIKLLREIPFNISRIKDTVITPVYVATRNHRLL